MAYKDKVKTAVGLDSIPGFMVLKPEAKTHRSELASWDKGHTIIRILPEIKDGQIIPARNSEEQNDFSDWITCENMVRKFGVLERFTCFTKAKDAPDDPSPIEVFTRAVHKAIKSDARAYPREWEEWTKGKANESPKLPRVDQSGIVQCVVKERLGKPLINEKTQKPFLAYPCVFMLTQSTRWSLEKLLNEPAERPGDTLDSKFAVGDFLIEGRLFNIHKVPRDGNTMAHYGIDYIRNSDGSSVPYPLPDEVLITWRPWEELLRFQTCEEQVKLLLRAFPAEIVDFAIGRTGFARYMPADALGAWFKKSADVGFVVPQAPVAVTHSVLPQQAPVRLSAPAQRAAELSQFVPVTELPEDTGETETPFDVDDDVEQEVPPINVPAKQTGMLKVKLVPSVPAQGQQIDPAKSAISVNDIRARLNNARGIK